MRFNKLQRGTAPLIKHCTTRRQSELIKMFDQLFVFAL